MPASVEFRWRPLRIRCPVVFLFSVTQRWVISCLHFGVVWVCHFGVLLVSFWRPPGAMLGSFLGPSGSLWCSPWGHPGVVLESYWSIPGSSRGRFGCVLGHLGVIQGLPRGRFWGVVLGSSWCHLGGRFVVPLGSFWGPLGAIVFVFETYSKIDKP